jgi:tetratricopeptide (TPR) repeat protein
MRGRKKTSREALQHFKRKHGLSEMQIKERLPSSPTPSVLSCDTLPDRAENQEEKDLLSSVHEHGITPRANPDEQGNALELSRRILRLGEDPARSPSLTSSLPPDTSAVTFQHAYYWQGGLHLNPSPSTPQQMLQMQRVASRTKDCCGSFLRKGKLGEGGSISVNNTYAFPCLMYNAGAHTAVGRLDIAMPYYDNAAALVTNLLKSQTPLCLILVYQLTCSRQRLGREPNTSAMLRFISELASDRLSRAHPIVQLIQSILDNPLTRDGLSELSVRQALVAFENSFGFVHGYTQEIAYRLCQALMNRGAYPEATPLLQKMVAAHEVLSGKCSYDACWTLMALGDCHLAQGNLVQAAQAYDDSAERARSPSIYQRDHIRVRYYQCTAELWRVRGELENAEVVAKLGIDLASQAFGPEDYRVISIRGILSKIEQQKCSKY